MHPRAIRALILGVSLLGEATATAQTRVVLVEPEGELEAALRLALEPWGLEVVSAASPAPGATMPDTVRAAHEVGSAQNAGAVVWISDGPGGLALWMYDARDDRATSRALAVRPNDAATAAAVALTIKALLRHSEVAPQDQRFGREPGATAGTPTVPPPAATAPATDSGSERSTRERTQPIPASWLDLEGSALLRWPHTEPAQPELRVGLALLLWPRASSFGLVTRFVWGPGVHLDNEAFQGRLVDTEVGLLAAARWMHENVQLVGAAGASLHVSTVEGTALHVGQPALDVRVDAALDLELGVDWLPTPWLRVGLRLGASWWMRAPRYLVLSQEVLEVAPLRGVLGLALATQVGH